MQLKGEQKGGLELLSVGPDIQINSVQKLSTIETPVLLVFGSSNCAASMREAIKLLQYYPVWQAKKEVEVVYINLTLEEGLCKDVPWLTFCDFKGLKTQAALDYFIKATPSYVLLDENKKILVFPENLQQVDAWVTYKL